MISIICLMLVVGATYIGINYSEILGVITAIIPILAFIVMIWNKDEVKFFSLISKVRNILFNQQANLRRYSVEKVECAVQQKENAEERLACLEQKLIGAYQELQQEHDKLDGFSEDIFTL